MVCFSLHYDCYNNKRSAKNTLLNEWGRDVGLHYVKNRGNKKLHLAVYINFILDYTILAQSCETL